VCAAYQTTLGVVCWAAAAPLLSPSCLVLPPNTPRPSYSWPVTLNLKVGVLAAIAAIAASVVLMCVLVCVCTCKCVRAWIRWYMTVRLCDVVCGCACVCACACAFVGVIVLSGEYPWITIAR